MFVINKEITIKSDPLSIEKIGKIDKDRLEKLWANSKTGNKMLKISYQRGWIIQIDGKKNHRTSS